MGVRRKLIFTFVRHGETDDNAQKVLQGSKQTTLNEIGREQARRLGIRLQREHARSTANVPSTAKKPPAAAAGTTPNGSSQATTSLPPHHEPAFHFVFSSDNPRAFETAQIVAEQLGQTTSTTPSTTTPTTVSAPAWGQVVSTSLLTERCLGVYEGRRSDQVLDEFGRLRWDHLSEPRMLNLWDLIAEETSGDQKGVETKEEFLSRAQRAIQFMIAHIVSFLSNYVSRNAIPEIRVLCVSHALFIRALLTQLLNIGTEWIMNVGSKGTEHTNFRWFACDIRNASVTRVQTEFVIYDAKRRGEGDELGGEKKSRSLKKKIRLMNPFLLCLNDFSHNFLDFSPTINNA